MILFVIIDALGWEQLQKRMFLNDIMPYRECLKTIFGYSTGAIPSILTGKPPGEHGHWNLFYLSPQTSPFAWIKKNKFINSQIFLENKYSREIIRRISRFKSGYKGTFSLPLIPFDRVTVTPGDYLGNFDICEKKWLFKSQSLDLTENIFDVLEKRAVSYNCYTYKDMNDEIIAESALGDIIRGAFDFYFIYFSEFDECQHLYCDDEELITKKIQWYDSHIRKLYFALRDHSKDNTMILCSDHGMAEVKGFIDLMSVFNELNIEFVNDYLAIFDSTMVRLWFFNEKSRDLITTSLLKLDCGRILNDQELDDLGVLFCDRRYGDIIFLLNEGWIIHPGMMGKWKPRGMHGYHPDCSSSYAIFLSDREPEFKPRCITDIFRILEDDINSMLKKRGN
ncbi:MAG TPA: alkaline phosphatase family protein [Spirochaetota bacterium]|nr:alkaline phosphatase family protein [Spirochaetota bacterium]HPR47776.1 alkaline phosphatase family protein [Spirochaetota bacterium]